MRKSKSYFFYYLKEDILLFDVFDYIEEIAADCVDYLHEWNLVKDGFVVCNKKILKVFIEDRIKKDVLIISSKLKGKNCKMMSFFHKKDSLNVWSNFFKEPLSFVKMTKRIMKKNLPNFVEVLSDKRLFQHIKGSFEDIPCIIPTGDDEEFLIKIQKKIKQPPLTNFLNEVK